MSGCRATVFNYLFLSRVHVLNLREGGRADGPVEEVLESLPQHVRDRRAALAELLQRRDHVQHQSRAAHLDVAVLQRGHLSKALRVTWNWGNDISDLVTQTFTHVAQFLPAALWRPV